MSVSIVEQARALHEDLERYERAVCTVLNDDDDDDDDDNGAKNSVGGSADNGNSNKKNSNNDKVGRKRGYKEKLIQSHKVRKLLDVMQDRARKLVRQNPTFLD